MEPLVKYATEQYELVMDSRKVLFDYCKTISPVDFLNENNSFGRGGSIRNLLVHIANSYQYWIDKYGLNRSVVFTSYHSMQGIDEIIALFDVVDNTMYDFIELFQKPETEIDYEIKGVKYRAGVFKFFSHVITHEFHHKGQILSISRHLGYTPVDTDIMR